MNRELRIAGGKKLKSPLGISTRPTTSRVREAVMNILQSKLHNCNWLDLFSGSGIMGCEALQKGAKKVIAVEKDKKTAKICKENLVSTAGSLSKNKVVEVIQDDVLRYLEDNSRKKTKDEFDTQIKFDIIYMDPPYEYEDIYIEVLQSLATGCWANQESIVICEHSSKKQIRGPAPWKEIENRVYGSTSLLILTLQN